MNKLTFRILPSEESHDHQVRIEIDGNDYLGEFLGIDPPHFFGQNNFFHEGKLLIGRCDCGCEGCCDTIIDVETIENQIVWKIDESTRFEFDKNEYTQYVNEKRMDFSWENLNRRVERLVSEEFKNTTIYADYDFDWASCRIEKNKILLSYSRKGNPENFRQEILKFDWNGINEEDALNRAKEYLKRNRKIKRKTP